jgi:hypothetical protein
VIPEFQSMSSDELIDYALEFGEGCGALEEYVKRLEKDPQTITLDPKTNPNWMEQFVEGIRQKYARSLEQ